MASIRIAGLFGALLVPAVASADPTTLSCGDTYYDDCFDCTTSDVEDDTCTTYTPAYCDQPLDTPDRIFKFTASEDLWIDLSSNYGPDLHMNLYVTQSASSSACSSVVACADWTGGGWVYADGWGGAIYGGVNAFSGETYHLSLDLNDRQSVYGDEHLEIDRFNCCYDRDGDGAYEATSTGSEPDCPFLEDNYPDLVDCDDADEDNFPTNPEVCDGKDNDCDGVADEGLPFYSWYLDADHDGYGAGTATSNCGAPTSEWTRTGGDCNDADADIHPTATELCNGVDDDCDGVIDDGVTYKDYYRDADGDGWGTGSASNDCKPPTGYVDKSGDCDDAVAAVNPGATEVCNEIDDDCDGSVDEGLTTTYYRDGDADGHGASGDTTDACAVPTGYTTTSDDCDDGSAARYPGKAETCDGIDNDCDVIVDEGTECFDDDGDGYTEKGGDCDDAASAEAPSGPELATCNGVDDDCDGVIDEGTPCFDDDGDGFSEDDGDCNDGDADAAPDHTEADGDGIDNDCDGSVDAGAYDPDDDGYGGSKDCDQEDASAYPGAPEACDGIDNDCDGVVDEGTDCYDDDGDGWTEVFGDCNDGDASIHEGADEDGTNGKDDDCDGQVDEGGPYTDDDGDGYSEVQGDCDDYDAATSAGADEVLNGEDDDCDGAVDEGLVDADADGVTEADGDCDDANGWVYPGALEMCDGLDNNCDSVPDEGCDDDGFAPTSKGGCNCDAGGATGAGFAWLLVGLVGLRRRVSRGAARDGSSRSG